MVVVFDRRALSNWTGVYSHYTSASVAPNTFAHRSAPTELRISVMGGLPR